MREWMIVGALALALGGCLQQTEGRAAATSCSAEASQPWRPISGGAFTVEATASGPDCEHAVATIVIRDAQDDVLWAEAAAVEHIMTLAGARTSAEMETALADWINSDNSTMATTSALPDWPENAAGPQNGEFPFYVDDAYNRAAYMTLRQSDAPLFCYVQGMESMACLALAGGEISKVGVQAFPG
jgi:hypothetical protein